MNSTAAVVKFGVARGATFLNNTVSRTRASLAIHLQVGRRTRCQKEMDAARPIIANNVSTANTY